MTKKLTLEVWVTDEAAAEMTAEASDSFEDIVDGRIIGARVALPDGNVLRVGETFG